MIAPAANLSNGDEEQVSVCLWRLWNMISNHGWQLYFARKDASRVRRIASSASSHSPSNGSILEHDLSSFCAQSTQSPVDVQSIWPLVTRWRNLVIVSASSMSSSSKWISCGCFWMSSRQLMSRKNDLSSVARRPRPTLPIPRLRAGLQSGRYPTRRGRSLRGSIARR